MNQATHRDGPMPDPNRSLDRDDMAFPGPAERLYTTVGLEMSCDPPESDGISGLG